MKKTDFDRRGLGMTDSDRIENNDVRQALDRILASDEFRTSPRLKEILRHIVERTLDGRADEISETALAIEVFARAPNDLDESDSVVRVTMARLRRKLSHYYHEHGQSDPVRIEIGSGSYTPSFRAAGTPPTIAEDKTALPARPGKEPAKRLASWTSSPGLVLSGFVLVAMLGALGAYLFHIGFADHHQVKSDVPFIAVIGLDSNTETNGYGQAFQTGVTSNLAKLSGLRVMAHSPKGAQELQNLSIGEMRQRYGLTHVIRGTYSRRHGNLRLDAELVETSTNHVIWAESFGGTVAEVSGFENRAITRVAEALSVVIRPDESQRLYLRHTQNLEAITLFTRAMRTLYPPYDAWRVFTAIELFEETTKIDPEFAGGYVGQSLAHAYLFLFQHTPTPDEELDRAIAFAKEAIDVDPQFATAYSTRGLAHALRKDYDQAIADTRRAIALQPSDPSAQAELARVLAFAGMHREALSVIDEALRLDPFKVRTPYRNIRGLILFNLGRYDEAYATFEENILIGGPNSPHFLLLRAVTADMVGKKDEARAHIARLNAAFPDLDARYWIDLWDGPEGRTDETLAVLSRLGLGSAQQEDADPISGPQDRT